MRLTIVILSLVATNVYAQEKLCKTNAQEQEILTSLLPHLQVLDEQVKSVPPEESAYLEAEFATMEATAKRGGINVERATSGLLRPLVMAYAIRKNMRRVRVQLLEIQRATDPIPHAIALMDLRDANRQVYEAVNTAVIGEATGDLPSAFYGLNKAAPFIMPAALGLTGKNDALRECVVRVLSESRNRASKKQM